MGMNKMLTAEPTKLCPLLQYLHAHTAQFLKKKKKTI